MARAGKMYRVPQAGREGLCLTRGRDHWFDFVPEAHAVEGVGTACTRSDHVFGCEFGAGKLKNAFGVDEHTAEVA